MIQPESTAQKVFDYHTLRTLVGVIAFALPIVVVSLSGERLNSISAYYWSDDSRDFFVGMLCIVGAFLLAYNGHHTQQTVASKVAALAAVGVAWFPTTCKGCAPNLDSYLHIASAVVLFAILAYFCHVFFWRARDKGKPRRANAYAACGVIIVVAMVAAGVGQMDGLKDSRIVYYAEWAALAAFGVAWFVAGVYQRLERVMSSRA